MNENLTCPFCAKPIRPEFVYCPFCNKKIRETALSVSATKQIVVYLVSFLLPPFGLSWAFRYLKMKDPVARRVGWISIALTVVSLFLAVALALSFAQNVNQQVSTEMLKYNNLGF